MSPRRANGARWVAIGIFASRLVGFVRERAFAHFFGVGPHTDVLKAAFRGPNLLQNLLGEGSLSAAFIPTYSRLLAAGREKDAGRLAGAILSLLVILAAALTLLGVLAARPLVAVFAPGFLGDAAQVVAGEATVDRFELTVTAVRWIFPMTGVLVLSAWALGVLNSHRRLLLPYLAPVVWNLSILAALGMVAAALVGGATHFGEGGATLFGRVLDSRVAAALPTAGRDRLVVAACAGALVGAFLQLVVQLPAVVRCLTGFRFSLSRRVEGVKTTLAALGPAVVGRGVYQLSAYLDLILASFLAAGALGALGFAIQLYVLPVSLFGLSVAAAELPELSRRGAEDQEAFGRRLRSALEQMEFFVLPTAVGYVLFGFLLVGALYRTGDFTLQDNALVWLILTAYALGLPATTASRQLQNAFYALGNTRSPARIAFLRLGGSVLVAVPAMLALDRIAVSAVPGLGGLAVESTGDAVFLGGVGLALGSAVGAWVELAALGAALRRTGAPFAAQLVPWRRMAPLGALALGAALPALVVWWALPPAHPSLGALVVVGVYAAIYLAAAKAVGLSYLGTWLGRNR